MGDGHLANPKHLIGNGSNYNAEIRITDNSKTCLIFIKQLFENLFDCSPPIFKEKSFYRLVTRSKVVHRFLSNICGISIGEKKNKTCVPKLIKGNEIFEKWFLSGFFDADGGIYRSRDRQTIRIKQHNKNLLTRCEKILYRNGIRISGIYADRGVRKGTTTTNYVLAIQKQTEVKSFIKAFFSIKTKR